MRLEVRVTPNAKKTQILEEGEGKLRVYLTAQPEKGKANKSLIAILSKYYGVKKSAVRILSGETSRDKVVEIDCSLS